MRMSLLTVRLCRMLKGVNRGTKFPQTPTTNTFQTHSFTYLPPSRLIRSQRQLGYKPTVVGLSNIAPYLLCLCPSLLESMINILQLQLILDEQSPIKTQRVQRTARVVQYSPVNIANCCRRYSGEGEYAN